MGVETIETLVGTEPGFAVTSSVTSTQGVGSMDVDKLQLQHFAAMQAQEREGSGSSTTQDSRGAGSSTYDE